MTTPLKFRNLNALPEDPVETWPLKVCSPRRSEARSPIGADWRGRSAFTRGDQWPSKCWKPSSFLVPTAQLNSLREWSTGPAIWLPIRSAPRWPLRSGIW